MESLTESDFPTSPGLQSRLKVTIVLIVQQNSSSRTKSIRISSFAYTFREKLSYAEVEEQRVRYSVYIHFVVASQMTIRPLSIDGTAVAQVKRVRDLGIYIGCDVVMRTQCSTNSIAMFRCTPSTTSDPPFVAASHIPVTLMLSGLDYGNAVLVGLRADV